MKRLGINTVHLNMKEIVEMGLNRVEFVLARGRDYDVMLGEVIDGIKMAEKKGLSYSVHLPLYLFDWYQEDYLSAFYLDPLLEKRQLANQFLRANLEEMKEFHPDYFIVHFPGVYKFEQDPVLFEMRLKEALDQLDSIAGEFGIRLLLEYFGSNFAFWEIERWIEEISPYENIGILCDTGHLYFSSVMHGFDFYKGLESLGGAADAFHIWTTRGAGVYTDSESYKKYHHIVVNTDQRVEQGFAFNGQRMMDIIQRFDRPMIIEASERYKGREYFVKGIKSIVDSLR